MLRSLRRLLLEVRQQPRGHSRYCSGFTGPRASAASRRSSSSALLRSTAMACALPRVIKRAQRLRPQPLHVPGRGKIHGTSRPACSRNPFRPTARTCWQSQSAYILICVEFKCSRPLPLFDRILEEEASTRPERFARAPPATAANTGTVAATIFCVSAANCEKSFLPPRRAPPWYVLPFHKRLLRVVGNFRGESANVS